MRRTFRIMDNLALCLDSHLGQDRAITADALCSFLGCTKNQLDYAIGKLRKRGTQIAFKRGAGYYLGYTAAGLRQAASSLETTPAMLAFRARAQPSG